MKIVDPRLSLFDVCQTATLYDLNVLEVQRHISHSSAKFKNLKIGLLEALNHGQQKLAVTWPDGTYALVTYSKRKHLEADRFFKPQALGVCAQAEDIYQVTDCSLISAYEESYPALFPKKIKKHMEATLCHQ